MAASRIPAVFFDVYMDAFSGVIVPEIHLVCRFPARLDAERLRRALRLALDAEPVAGCTYVPRFIAPYWRRLGAAALDRSALVEGARADGDAAGSPMLRRFLEERLDPAGPRARALILSFADGDLLALKVDHQTADAAAVKAFAYLICDIYNALGRDPEYRPEENQGPRGVDQIFGRVLPGNRRRMLSLAAAEAKSAASPFSTLTFGGTSNRREGAPIFSLRTWDPERIARAMEKARAQGATVNDCMLAAYIRALARETRWRPGRMLRVMGTVDVRRYLPPDARPGMANLSSMYCANLENDLGRDFSETLLRVKALMDRGKREFLGLPLMAGGMMLIGLLPAGLKKPAAVGPLLMGGRKGNFPPGYTNLGTIAPDRLAFGGAVPVQAFCVTPPARPPFFVLGFSGFAGGVTVSSGYFESSLEGSRVESLFTRMEEELFS